MSDRPERDDVELANVQAVIDAAKQALEHPAPEFRTVDYFEHCLGTFGHGYSIEGYAAALAVERQRAEGAEKALVSAWTAGGALYSRVKESVDLGDRAAAEGWRTWCEQEFHPLADKAERPSLRIVPDRASSGESD